MRTKRILAVAVISLAAALFFLSCSGPTGPNGDTGLLGPPAGGVNPTLVQGSWVKYPGNPVLMLGSPGEWDDEIVESPWVMHDGNEYLMYFTGRSSASPNPERIGLATSADAINWTKLVGNPLPITPSQSWDSNDRRGPVVLFDGLEYKMWYTGNFNKVGLATSTDGRTWTRHPSNPVLSPGPSAWDAFRVNVTTVIWDGSQYRMWYWGISSGLERRIGYASSPDGINWTKLPNPVLGPSASGWDDRFVYSPSVIWNGSSFEMWYTGQSGGTSGIGYAISSDGITWVKQGQILDSGDRDPMVRREGSLYRMWFVSPPSGIHYATLSAPTVHLDIKPSSCPNPLNPKSRGMFPAAILGTPDCDVRDIDVSSLLLEGVAPIRSSLEDVATPVVPGDACQCTTEGLDGFDDLTLKFSSQDIANALGPVFGGDVRVLTITGNLLDGTPFEASDCVVIVGRPELGKGSGEPARR